MTAVSSVATFLRENTNERVFRLAKAAHQTILRPSKTETEMNYWTMKYKREGGRLKNGHYETLMREMAKPLTEDDLAGKLVCDFGCGPRGSLTWLTDRAHCVGIDLLVSDYMAAFPAVMRDNNMTYVGSSEHHIPIQSGQADILFTMNALDHVAALPTMCDELLRILKPGGHFIGSFNIGEPATVTEPQSLDEATLDALLLDRLEEMSRRFAPKFHDSVYAGFFGRAAAPGDDGPRVMWYVGRKPG